MLTKKELKEMIAEQINEMQFGLTSPLDARMQAAKAEKIIPIEEYIEEIGFAPDIKRNILAQLHSLDSSDLVDALAAVNIDDHNELYRILSPASARGVDPFAVTAATDLTSDTIKMSTVPRITESRLRQIIKEELMVILTDDEVEEMFGIDPGEASKEV
jgi:hypothetical protein